ncbi:MAG: glycoside hydrolase family 2 protein [Anaerolineae bacterium]|nr:glycoside hydrolase family 2 protein [Anaerolineae bacterium]
MRKCILFNHDWLFAAGQLSLDAPDGAFEAITLPHTNKIFPHHNFDNREYQFISTYRKRFYVSHDDATLVFLDFEGVMLAGTLYLNGEPLGEHRGGYTPFSFDITPALQTGENVLTVYVDGRERKDIPPFGHLVDYLTFGGIYRDVYLRVVAQTHIENVFVQPLHVLDHPQVRCAVRLSDLASRNLLRGHAERSEGSLPCEAEISRFARNDDLADTHLSQTTLFSLEATLLNPQGEAIATVCAPVEGTTTALTFASLPDVRLWSLDDPQLYSATVRLLKEGNPVDEISTRFGFRAAEFRPDGGFYLNGKRLSLFGLNRHQTYPYIGAAAPARLQRQDAEILKFELGCNIVRTSHYPQSPHFLDRCDEIGLLVFEEIAGWQAIGDEAWQQLCLNDLQTMIERDRNRPAVILWGVRINESGDNDDFYTRTNALAHRLDPTRQTGGVRCFLGSSFLEDVYTYNDFSNTVLEPTEQPHLITEFAGHMFPTKPWDHEERLIDHALLHARVQELQMGNPRVAGAIGWCAFDYATHMEFGSGDRICYHGVMDIFRLPKWAAYFYKSQQPPSKQIVLQALTHWTMGDRAGGGNNPLTVFSNCDAVEIVIGGTSAGRFQPDRETYPHLAHPPFTIRGLDEYSAWGQAEFHDLQLIGYIREEPVAEQWIASNRLPKKLELAVGAPQLYADGADMTRLVFRITDAFGNPLPYAIKVVAFDLEGPADLIGENPFPLVGGQAALYVKARRQAGAVAIHAHAPGLESSMISLEIVAPGKI